MSFKVANSMQSIPHSKKAYHIQYHSNSFGFIFVYHAAYLWNLFANPKSQECWKLELNVIHHIHHTVENRLKQLELTWGNGQCSKFVDSYN